MNIDSIVSRLQDVNNQLMTISTLARIPDMTGKKAKTCSCQHHRSETKTRCCGKKSSPERKKPPYSCGQRIKICSCSRQVDGESVITKPKRSDIEDDPNNRTAHDDIEILHVKKPAEKELFGDRIGDKRENIHVNVSTNVTTSEHVTEAPAITHESKGTTTAESSQMINDRSKNLPNSRATNTVSSNAAVANENFQLGNLEDSKNYELLYQNLKNRNLELEKKLESMDCSMSCLKTESEKQAACLEEALEKAKRKAQLAERARNLATDLAKQSRDQTDLVKASKDAIVNEMNIVKANNSELRCKCEELICKMREITDNEAKKFAETDDNFKRFKHAVRENEITLSNEKCKLENTVQQLLNGMKKQKKRICDLTSLCTRQQDLLRENENCIATKIAQLTETEEKVQSTNCKCKKMQEQIDHLQCQLNEARITRENMEKELHQCQDRCDCELQIKDKIIQDQGETVKKLKKLLQESEKMAHQAACEFESLRNEVHYLKQSNQSLQMTIDESEVQLSEECAKDYCDRCNFLEDQINNLAEQKEKAIIAAKLAASKLYKTTNDYEHQLECMKRQNDYMKNFAEQQDVEIQLLKKEILCVKEFRNRRVNNFIDH